MSRVGDIVSKLKTTEPAESAHGDERTGASRRMLGQKHPPARVHAPRLIFIASVIALLGIGLVMVYSASSIEGLVTYNDPAHFFKRQAIFLVIGAIACIAVSILPYQMWSGRIGYMLIGLMVLMLIAVQLFGDTRLGSTRWISIGGFDFQPSEFAKIAIVLVSAGLQVRLVEATIDRRSYILGILGSVIVPLGLIIIQPDMGTTAIAAIGFMAVLWFGGVPKSLFVWIIGAAVVVGVLAIVTSPYRLERFTAGFNPNANPQGEGYQLINSLQALGSGGLFGLGLGNSRQKYFYLPESHNDFIFAIIGEELGLVGCLVVVALFVALFVSGMRIARNAGDRYGRLIAAACTTLIGFQALVNILQTIGLFPVTGKPLPFVSYGGSSLLASLLLVGFVLSVSLHSDPESVSASRRDSFRILDGGDEGLGGREDWANRGMTPRGGRAEVDDGFEEGVRVVSRGSGRTRRTYSDASGSDRGRVISFDEAEARDAGRSSDARRSSRDRRSGRGGQDTRRR